MLDQLRMFISDTPSMNSLDLSRCVVREISHSTAARMVKEFHYAHRVPSISYSFGLYVDDILAGCITYGNPASSKTSIAVCGEKYKDIVFELNRLFCHEWVGKNSESFLIGRSFRLLPKPSILVSFADTGENHLGYIYQATNWIYTGLSDASGCFSKIEIGNKERTSKSFYDELGSQSKETILARYPSAIFHEYTQKHRYVYFLGNKKEKKEMFDSLKWSTYKYPKGNGVKGL